MNVQMDSRFRTFAAVSLHWQLNNSIIDIIFDFFFTTNIGEQMQNSIKVNIKLKFALFT